jgi:flavin-dependent dehydrogenase
MVESVDVCIFGQGPAGSCTALRLAASGTSVLMLERSAPEPAWVGESFSGAIRAPLESLGLWTDFRAAGHIPSYEIRSAWGEFQATAASALFRPHGHGWHVDRKRFDEDLRTACMRNSCASRQYRKLVDIRRLGAKWRIHLDDTDPLDARFVVDATGRCCAIGRRLGARRRHFDRLVALVAKTARNPDPAYANAIVVEAAAEGWWYAAPVPAGHVVAFLTDRDLLAQAPSLRGLHLVAADSALIDGDSAGPWLAVGDAFAAHDPLFGWGVIRAMNNGIAAADAIVRFLRDRDSKALDAYRDHCVDEFRRYLDGLVRHYALERRWSTSTFWARRLSGAPHG